MYKLRRTFQHARRMTVIFIQTLTLLTSFTVRIMYSYCNSPTMECPTMLPHPMTLSLFFFGSPTTRVQGGNKVHVVSTVLFSSHKALRSFEKPYIIMNVCLLSSCVFYGRVVSDLR
ncbi:hypothetical protein EDB87DRAFT_742340 [Lactarius vividus]|nr:hypothetical protein EDB87DRAFT_742340 [Lactarius vividus]